MPWTGVSFSAPYLAFLLYVFVITSYVVPAAQVAMVLAMLALTVGGKDRWRSPLPVTLLLLFFAFAAVGYKLTRFASYVWDPLMDLAKVVIVGWVAVSVLTDRARVRFFTFFYLAVFALFPIRGAMFNKFIYHADTQGRVAWNNAFANPNDMAALVIFPLGLAAAVFFTERHHLIKKAALVGVLVLPLVIFLTQSRGAILALGATVMFYLVIQGKGRMRTIMALGAAAVLISIFAPNAVWGRLASLRSATKSGDMQAANDNRSAEQRLEIMKVAAEVAKEYPVTGVGWGAYPSAHNAFSRRSKFSSLARGDRDAHNTYLTLAAETGLVGLFLWLGVVFAFVRVALKGMRDIRPYAPEYALQIKFILLTLFAFGVAGVFGSFAHMSQTYLYLATIYALGMTASQEARRLQAEQGGEGGATPQVARATSSARSRATSRIVQR